MKSSSLRSGLYSDDSKAALSVIFPGCVSPGGAGMGLGIRIFLLAWWWGFYLFFPLAAQKEWPAAGSGNASGVRITLEEVLAEGERNNPGVRAAEGAWKASLQRAPQVRVLPFPQVDMGFALQRDGERFSPVFKRIGVMQHFHWFGKLALMGAMAEREAEINRKLYENARLELVFRVKEAYFDLYLAHRREKILTESLMLLKNMEEAARRMYAAGGSSYSDVLRLQVEGDKLENERISAGRLKEPAQTRLMAALGAPRGEGRLEPAPPALDTPDLDERVLQERLKTGNPVIGSMDDMIEMRGLGVRLARKNFYPDFSIGVDYMFSGDAGMAGMPGVPAGVSEPLSAVLSLKIPLWSGKNKAALREAEIMKERGFREKEAMADSMLAHLAMLIYEYEDARRKMSLYRDKLLPRAREALEVARTAYGAGKAKFMDFIDTQRLWLEFGLMLEETEMMTLKRLAEIEKLTGGVITPGGGAAAGQAENAEAKLPPIVRENGGSVGNGHIRAEGMKGKKGERE